MTISEVELRKIRFEIVVAMLNEDERLREQVKVYLWKDENV